MLDSRTHPPLRPLKDRGKTLLGYISVGEVETHRPWFGLVKGWGILDQENPNWPGSFYVDVRDRRWVKLVVEGLVPALLRSGFDGVFLDTLDNPPHLERTDPKRWAGMTGGAARLVGAIRRNWPQIRVMQNRAYEILPQTARSIDFALGESVYAGWDFAAKRPHLQSDEDYRFQVEALKEAKALNPVLGLFSLDYWDPADTAGVRAIYARQRANGFSPYVSVVELDRLVAEPPP
ncbi:endo alpha-1,4 polygalactosaminidase [Azospirillum agricola]|uniref:endo alpha-1,4 polygalactosaminidase n=1 Tax=Azospirillum agricola TaxID=1720247 RepID=UPI000A0F1FB6|nr:endo alpha-1,4 polygalactosaminidase [Azospirillum agricola]SMH35934.1 extracellular protein [Azospirillum lipoferum]